MARRSSGRKKVWIYGAGGHGKVVADAARSQGLFVVAFVDDAPKRSGSRFFGLPIVTWEEFKTKAPRAAIIALAIGDNVAREHCFMRIKAEGFDVATIVHRSAVIAPSAMIERGTVVMAGAVVNPDARVGPGAILNTHCVVEHDVILGDFVHISPNAALGGGACVGRRSHVGLGASVLPLVSIGEDVRVGAGAVVIDAVADSLTVVGVPARPLKAAAAAVGRD